MGCSPSSLPQQHVVQVAPAGDPLSNSSCTMNSHTPRLDTPAQNGASRALRTTSLSSYPSRPPSNASSNISRTPNATRRESSRDNSARRDYSSRSRRNHKSSGMTPLPATNQFSASGRFQKQNTDASLNPQIVFDSEKTLDIFESSPDDGLVILKLANTPAITDPNSSFNLGDSMNRALLPSQATQIPVRICGLCQSLFTTKGRHIPLLLLCGHSFCKDCLELAISAGDVSRIKCPCGIDTDLDAPQDGELLLSNKAMLGMLEAELIHSSKLLSKKDESCAECEISAATRYCADCVASYCEQCCQNAHEKLRILSRHKPVPISQRPLPVPMCKLHPGQSYKLYCETDRMPMCLMCKYSTQHRGHSFDLLTRVSQKYLVFLQDQLKKVQTINADIYRAIQETKQSADMMREEARIQQLQLEEHFALIKYELVSALDQRENKLLQMLDQQVQAKSDMLHEQRIDQCVAFSKATAAEEECERLMNVNPVTMLLSRNHMDDSMFHIMSLHLPLLPENESHVPVNLSENLKHTFREMVSVHGDVLQLPGEPWFLDVRVSCKSVQLEWEALSIPGKGTEHNKAEKSFVLECYTHDKDIKIKMKVEELNRSKHLLDFMGVRSKSRARSRTEQSSDEGFISGLPSSIMDTPLLERQSNSSNSTMQDAISRVINVQPHSKKDLQENPTILEKSGNDNGSYSSLTSISKKISPTKSAQDIILRENDSPFYCVNHLAKTHKILKLPPLISSPSQLNERYEDNNEVDFAIKNKQSSINSLEQQRDTISNKTAVIYEEQDTKSDCGSFSSDGNDYNQYDTVDKFQPAMPYHEIYSGSISKYVHRNLLQGTTYFYRVRCKNNAGSGPWSKVLKCTTRILINNRTHATKYCD